MHPNPFFYTPGASHAKTAGDKREAATCFSKACIKENTRKNMQAKKPSNKTNIKD
jgi:hypothetical protein